jgi:hypothetical protein
LFILEPLTVHEAMQKASTAVVLHACDVVHPIHDTLETRRTRPSPQKLHSTLSLIPASRAAAWHDAGTFDASNGSGGATGTIRFDKEINAAPNAGLGTALKLLEKIKKDHPEVGYADLMQMASAAAIEVRPWRPLRPVTYPPAQLFASLLPPSQGQMFTA